MGGGGGGKGEDITEKRRYPPAAPLIGACTEVEKAKADLPVARLRSRWGRVSLRPHLASRGCNRQGRLCLFDLRACQSAAAI